MLRCIKMWRAPLSAPPGAVDNALIRTSLKRAGTRPHAMDQHYLTPLFDPQSIVLFTGPQQQPDMLPWWTTYFAVESVEATSAAVVANGGSIIAPAMDVMEAGRMAVVADPHGAVFSLWQANGHAGIGVAGVLGSRCWSELATRHPDAAGEFYAAVFGWRPVEFTGSHYVRFEHGDDAAGGMLHLDETFPAEIPEHWVVYFLAPDAAATCAQAAALGATIMMPPTPIPMIGQFAVLFDPQGATFNLLQPDPQG